MYRNGFFRRCFGFCRGGSKTCPYPDAAFVLVIVCLLATSFFLSAPALGGEIAGRVTNAKGEPVAQAVVFIKSLPADAQSAKVPASIEMDQVQRQFVPHLLLIPVGAEVRFPNRDQIHHHVYSFSRTKSFELPLYKEEEAPPVRFETPGVVKIGCNIHDWMSAIIFVSPTPYFAVSDEAGKFLLPDVPNGSYALLAWHELSQVKVGDTTQQIQVSEQPSEVNFSLSLLERRSGAPARKGGNY